MEDDERAPAPLLGAFEKYPEYIEIQLKPQAACLTESNLLTDFNKHALNSILDQKTRELIHLKSFPVVLRIFLVPKLNILTVQKQSETEISID